MQYLQIEFCSHAWSGQLQFQFKSDGVSGFKKDL